MPVMQYIRYCGVEGVACETNKIITTIVLMLVLVIDRCLTIYLSFRSSKVSPKDSVYPVRYSMAFIMSILYYISTLPSIIMSILYYISVFSGKLRKVIMHQPIFKRVMSRLPLRKSGEPTITLFLALFLFHSFSTFPDCTCYYRCTKVLVCSLWLII